MNSFGPAAPQAQDRGFRSRRLLAAPEAATTGLLDTAFSHFDKAIVAAVLAADGVFGVAELAGTVLLGELGLDGRVRPVHGVLPALLAALRQLAPLLHPTLQAEPWSHSWPVHVQSPRPGESGAWWPACARVP